MNHIQAFKFLEELKKSGKLEEFMKKDPYEMTPEEREFYEFEDPWFWRKAFLE